MSLNNFFFVMLHFHYRIWNVFGQIKKDRDENYSKYQRTKLQCSIKYQAIQNELQSKMRNYFNSTIGLECQKLDFTL